MTTTSMTKTTSKHLDAEQDLIGYVLLSVIRIAILDSILKQLFGI